MSTMDQQPQLRLAHPAAVPPSRVVQPPPHSHPNNNVVDLKTKHTIPTHTAILPGNNNNGSSSILFNHLQRKTVPRSINPTSTTSATQIGNSNTIKNGIRVGNNLFGINDVNNPRVGHGIIAQTTTTNAANLYGIALEASRNGGGQLRSSASDGLIEGSEEIVVGDEEEENDDFDVQGAPDEEFVMIVTDDDDEMEEVVESVLEITDDKIIFGMNDSGGEIIEDDGDLEVEEEVCELEYVVEEDAPIEIGYDGERWRQN